MPNQNLDSWFSILESQLDKAVSLIKQGETETAVAKIEEAKKLAGTIAATARNG